MADRTGWLFNGGASSFVFVGEPVRSGDRAIQKARSNSGAVIFQVSEPKNGVPSTRWIYPSDRDYKEIVAEYGGD